MEIHYLIVQVVKRFLCGRVFWQTRFFSLAFLIGLSFDSCISVERVSIVYQRNLVIDKFVNMVNCIKDFCVFFFCSEWINVSENKSLI